MSKKTWRDRVSYPRTRLGTLWVMMSAIAILAILGRWGRVVISVGVHAAAWFGDAGDQIHPVVGQVLMVGGMGGLLIGVVAIAVVCLCAVIGTIVTLTESIVASII